MKNIKLAIFDMDGLMLDTEKLYFDTALAVAGENNYKVTKELLFSIIGITVEDTEKKFKNALGYDFPLESYTKSTMETMSRIIERDGIAVKEGLFELLEFLDSNKISKVVATSNYRNRAEWLLDRAGVRDRFEKVICGDDVKNGKPSPDIFLKACEVSGIDRTEAIVLEDSINGLKAAEAAGIRCILIPDLIEPTPEEVKIAYKKLNNLKEVIDILQVIPIS